MNKTLKFETAEDMLVLAALIAGLNKNGVPYELDRHANGVTTIAISKGF